MSATSALLRAYPVGGSTNERQRSDKWLGRLRGVFEGFTLSEFRVTELDNTAPAIWLSRGQATVNDSPGTFECRWILEEADGGFGYGSDSALWRLVFCDPTVWRRSE